MVDRFTHGIYPAGAEGALPEPTRKIILREFGILERNILTRRGDRELASATDTVQVLNSVLDDPNSLTLVAFPGRLEEGWTRLIEYVYESIVRRQHWSEGEVQMALTQVTDMLTRMADTRRAMGGESIEIPPLELVRRVAESVEQPQWQLGAAMQATKQRVMLVMLSNGPRYLEDGQAAAQLGLIDGAFETFDTSSHPDRVREILQERLRAGSA